MQQCNKCELEKSLDSFDKHRRACKECRKKFKRENYHKKGDYYREQTRQYRIKNIEKIKKYSRIYRKKYYSLNKESLLEYGRKYHLTNRKVLLENQKIYSKKFYMENRKSIHKQQSEYYQTIKREIVDVYSGGKNKCACCNEKQIHFLTLDHIKDDGKEDRKKHGAGFTFFLYLKRHGYPQKGLQILCYNCNMSKRFFKVCPHKLK